MKRWIAVVVFLSAAPCFALDGRTEPSFDAKPVYDSLGNVARDFSTSLSTREWVLISSAAVGATGIYTDTQPLNIESWLFREVVNRSTCSALTLLAHEHRYQTFISSFGVKLSSDSTGLGAGSAYILRDQAAYWGRWSPDSGNGSCAAGAGANTKESYYQENRRR